MRRLPVILLLIVYAITSSGFTLRAEFCCGSIKAIHLDAWPVTDCDPMKRKHTGKGPCCRSTEIALQLSTDQQAATVHQELPVPLVTVPPVLFAGYGLAPAAQDPCIPPRFADPSPPVDRQVLFCTYRI